MTTRPVALTLGEPAGIGGEISLKAWQTLKDVLPFFLIGDVDHMRDISRRFDVPVEAITAPEQAMVATATGLPVLHHPLKSAVEPGVANALNAPVVIEMIERAVSLTRDGAASAITTNPINKQALHEGAGFAFPGHTEFLAALAGGAKPVMMLSAPELRVVPTTIHIALADVPRTLTPHLLEQTLRITHRAMRDDLGIENPRIAVAGLNPHAGEGGAMGHEEAELMAPLLDKLRAEGMVLLGPLPSDTMFHAKARAQYDIAVCMYHDQALIPIKTLNFSAGVNTTLGLPFVRTSPDHGTAFDIAGKGIADPTSLIEALRTAANMARHRSGK